MRNYRGFILLFSFATGLLIVGVVLYSVRGYLPLAGMVLLIGGGIMAALTAIWAVIYGLLALMHKSMPVVEKLADVREQARQTSIAQQHVTLMEQGFQYGMQTGALVEMVAPSGATMKFQTRALVREIAPPAQQALPPPKEGSDEEALVLPGRCDLSDVLEYWTPTPEKILLGLGPGERLLTVPVKSLVHGALAGATGLGKSVIMRLLLSQLVYIGAQVVLCDPHYADVDPESGEDWRPIASRLYTQPVVAYDEIEKALRWMAEDQLPTRLQRRRAGMSYGKPVFLAMDELPAIVAHVPDAPALMAEILREGRKVGLYLISAAQDFLVKTIGGSGAVRDCFRTAFYVGGDAQTARILLDVKGTVDDGGLGKGIVMLRSAATPKAALTRVPYVSNEALFDMLQYYPGTGRGTHSGTLRNTGSLINVRERLADTPESVPAVPVPETPQGQNIEIDAIERERIIQLRKDGTPRREICAALGVGKWYYPTVQRVLDEEGL